MPWRLCRTILAELADNTVLGQVVPSWFHEAGGTGGVEGEAATATPADMGIYNKPEIVLAETPGTRQYNQRGGRPGLDVDFVAVCDAVLGAWSGSGETVTDVACRFGVSRGWIWKWVYPALLETR